MDLTAVGRGPGVPYLRLFRPGATSSLQLVLLSDQLQAWATHWAGDREQLCRRELQRPCQWCDVNMETRPAVYALAMHFRSRILGIAHITAGAFRYCQQLQDNARNARGLCVELRRLGPGRAGVRATVKAERWPLDQLPAVGDWLQLALFRLWGVLPTESAAELAGVGIPSSLMGQQDLAEGELPAEPDKIGPGCAGRIEDGSEQEPRVRLGQLFRERSGRNGSN